MGNETKISRYVDQAELATFLRDLADAVESGGKDEFACVDEFSKLKISIKNEFGQLALKAKFKSALPCDEPGAKTGSGEPAKPKYKQIKKRMRSSFKMLVKLIHEGEAPPEEAVRSFLEDSALMVTYPGYGDEYYESYSQACEAFKDAFESGDVDRMHETIDVIVHEKSRCHAKYD
ncbi:GAK system XXXCH domain-containing protein [Pseudodesulfovibrio cashew]|uniref:GAK system XXXCH domain-containing protein n=2 Tax=Pseudodesulfovibrio cashew TaxID=2678688 RepID=A0A6I6JI79_9BACT|nr:GAK system XXXCH domain-containing protein [Pseudodesulfovibrio cashew]